MAQAKDASLMVKAVLTSSKLPMASAPVMSELLQKSPRGESVNQEPVAGSISTSCPPTGLATKKVERLKGLGATKYEDHRKPDGTGWVTMADPEGNLFCVERSAAER